MKLTYKQIVIYDILFVTLSTTLIFISAFRYEKKFDKSGKPFIIFNAIHYKNTPDLSNQSVHPLYLVYESHLLSPNPINPKSMLPDKDSIRHIAMRFIDQPGIPVSLDIEAWSYSPGDLSATINSYLQVAAVFKETNSKSPIGYYGVVPKDAYQWKNIKPEGGSNYNKWQNLNRSLQAVADKIDIFFPSFYTYDNDTIAWKNFVEATLDEIKRYHRNIPVYAYIWPQYHNATSMSLQFVDREVWKFQLETLYSLTDGIVIWTSNKDAVNQIISWNEMIPWWQITRAFINEHHIQ